MQIYEFINERIAGIVVILMIGSLMSATARDPLRCALTGGVLLDTAGAKMMLLVSTILTGVGAAMVVLLVGRIRQKNDKTQQTAA